MTSESERKCCFISRLIVGYVIHPDERIDVVESCDLELYKWGEDGEDPEVFDFNFKAGEPFLIFKKKVQIAKI